MEEVSARTLMQPCGDGSGWFGHNWNVNLYRGYCHGCIYCDSRSSCYQVHEFDRAARRTPSRCSRPSCAPSAPAAWWVWAP